MSFLLIYIGEGQRFDVDEVAAALRTIPNVDHVEASNVFKGLLETTFAFGSDSVIVRLTDDAESIFLSSDGDAALQFALELKERIPARLHMIDEGYMFDIALAEHGSLDDLRRAMQPDRAP